MGHFLWVLTIKAELSFSDPKFFFFKINFPPGLNQKIVLLSIPHFWISAKECIGKKLWSRSFLHIIFLHFSLFFSDKISNMVHLYLEKKKKERKEFCIDMCFQYWIMYTAGGSLNNIPDRNFLESVLWQRPEKAADKHCKYTILYMPHFSEKYKLQENIWNFIWKFSSSMCITFGF